MKNKKKNDGMLSEKYRLMIYFIIGTIHLYSSEEIILSKDFDVFFESNPELKKRVFEECKLSFDGYELSGYQMMTGFMSYFQGKVNPQKISQTEAYDPKKD